ncbi:hypothetical protein WQ56_12335 [Luteimonas sp. FCS-9]|nr:hypothetical protein WQ56_12335 [Luteimonas sp. FCS-9]
MVSRAGVATASAVVVGNAAAAGGCASPQADSANVAASADGRPIFDAAGNRDGRAIATSGGGMTPTIACASAGQSDCGRGQRKAMPAP